ncbi:MAG: circularly permuted type 2 ATP-grasp protein [Candidatus Omnitrophota bacterium]
MLADYKTDDYYDEMLQKKDHIRPSYSLLAQKISRMSMEELHQKQFAAERAYVSMGITFNVYHEGKGLERTLPFDIIPRIINRNEWQDIDRGLKQRVQALNVFLGDIYNAKHILKDKIIPEDIIYSSPGYLKECEGLTPPKGRWAHISGIDLIKHADGKYYILEDNLRVPSGVSYVLGNREIMKRVFPDLFAELAVAPVFDYPLRLLDMLQKLSHEDYPNVVLLTPGIYNSAYFEHSFLAQQMGVELVEGRDLTVQNDFCYMRTTKGLKKVDVIYRRIDDTFLDPLAFNPNSVLGVPGLFGVYKKGNIVIANAPGTGVADDKVVYAYVPQIIKYYLEEEPILPNVPTYLCWDSQQRQHVLNNMSKMVVKLDSQSGGYGMLMGNQAEKKQIEEFSEKIKANPRNYIAQPVMALSRVPTIIGENIEGRHVDLRPFVLYGSSVYVMPGGLSRVALKKGSLVVNSSQGGGSKDTWVMQREFTREEGCYA